MLHKIKLAVSQNTNERDTAVKQFSPHGTIETIDSTPANSKSIGQLCPHLVRHNGLSDQGSCGWMDESGL